VERFGCSRPDRLEFVRVSVERSARELDRDDFYRWIAASCAKEFPDDTVDSSSIHQDLAHSLSGNYARGILRSGSARWAAIAANEHEATTRAGRFLTLALLWFDRLRESHGKVPPRDCACCCPTR